MKADPLRDDFATPDVEDRPVSARSAAGPLALVQAGIAALTLEFAAGDGTWRDRAVGCATVAGLAAGLLILRRRRDRRLARLPSGLHESSRTALALTLCGLWCLPFLLEFLPRWEWLGVGHPLEVRLLGGLRNVSLGLAILGVGPRVQPTTCALSMFLALFASAISSDPLVHVLVATFTVTGILWLMSVYWESLRDRLQGETHRRMPRRGLLVLPIILAGVLLIVPVAGHYATTALPGFVGSSGGHGEYDVRARGGVNDGDALVAATQNAHSFGPVESELFLDSEDPSLYDVFSDMYGDPPKSRTVEKAISLPPELAREVEQRIAKSEQAGREFSSVRQPPKQTTKPLDDRTSNALLHVSGRVPLHLRLQTYDIYDGVTWHPEPPMDPPLSVRMQDIGGKPWVEFLTFRGIAMFTGRESHALKIVRLDTNRIPGPLHLTGIHIDRVDRPDMFLWAEPSILRMDRDKLPGMIVIHQQSLVQDPKKLRKLDLVSASVRPLQTLLPTDDATGQVGELAREWTAGVESGWPQVERIVERLRRSCVLDREAVSSKECANTAAEFLLSTRRGNDYHFATAASVLLRSLGMTTRLVSGFYAAPANYDARSRLTPVAPEDVHVWLEVSVGPGTWATVEPTPGYEVLRPPPTFVERVLAVLWGCWNAVTDRPFLSMALMVLAIAAWRGRIALADVLLTAVWRLRPHSTSRRQIHATLGLLERRLAWSGRARTCGTTPVRHLQSCLSDVGPDESGHVRTFLRLVNAALYAPDDLALTVVRESGDVASTCRRIVRDWPLRRLQGHDAPSRVSALLPASFHRLSRRSA